MGPSSPKEMGTFQRDDGCNNVLLLPPPEVLGTELVVSQIPRNQIENQNLDQPTQLDSAGDFILTRWVLLLVLNNLVLSCVKHRHETSSVSGE